MKKVSVIVPVYNSSEYLEDCLKSLLNQTLEDIEIIAIDDCSLDDSLDILRKYERNYPDKLIVKHNDKNIGQGATRNIGMKFASGEYIGFLDSDDYVSLKMYENMYEAAKNNDNPDVVTTGLLFVKDNHYLMQNMDYMKRDTKGTLCDVLADSNLILNQTPSVCNKVFRKDFIVDKLFLEGVMWEDVAFSYSQMFNADKVLFLNNNDYFYRKRSDSGVSSKGFVFNENVLDIFKVTDEIGNATMKSGRYELLKDNISFIQSVACLQRVSEILSWDISLDDKKELCLKMKDLINQKYGNIKNLNQDLLSSRIDPHTLSYLNELDMYKSEHRLKH